MNERITYKSQVSITLPFGKYPEDKHSCATIHTNDTK